MKLSSTCTCADGAGRGAHAHRDARALERRAGRRRGAKHPFPISHHHFAIRSEIHQGHQFTAFVQAGGHDAGQNVRADKTAEAWQKFHHSAVRQIPTQLARRELNPSLLLRLERMSRQRRDVHPAKQMVHDGIADDDDAVLFPCRSRREEALTSLRPQFQFEPRYLVSYRIQVGSPFDRVAPARAAAIPPVRHGAQTPPGS